MILCRRKWGNQVTTFFCGGILLHSGAVDPATILLPLAKSILAQVGKELAGPAVRGAKSRVLGDREQRALRAALGRAFGELGEVHGRRLAEFDVNAGFWEHEGGAEIAKVLVPGVRASPVRLAERAVDSLGPCRSDDERFDRIALLRPVFTTLFDRLADEVRREPDLRGVFGRDDEAETARAAVRVAEHLGATAATDDDRGRYLQWLIDQHRYVKTAGVVRKTLVQLPLGEVFVGLLARRDQHPGDRARAWFDQEREKLAAQVRDGQLDQAGLEAALDRLQVRHGHRFATAGERVSEQPTPVLDMIRDAAQMLVLGDPGSGKTTLLRYLALGHAQALRTGAPVRGRPARFPIYLRIAEYARHGYPAVGISEFIPAYLRRSECRTPGVADLLHRELENGRCLVLLDGLDEITSAELRRGVVTAVLNFVTAHARQGNRFVVTSRIAGYQAAPLPEPFRAVRMVEMDDDTIRLFLDVYCREVERAETPDRTDAATMAAGAQEAEAITQALGTNAGVRRLAANPLLLTALVLVHRASGRLPHRRVEAYTEVCTALGRSWRSVQGVAEADLPDERILTRWLTVLGAWLHEHRPEGAATRLELLEVLGPLWARHQGSPWDPAILTDGDPLGSDAGRAIIEFAETAEKHTGLLVERAPGRYGFAHLTFEEYYAGRALAFLNSSAGRITAIRRRLHDPRYEEPILLALGLIATDYAEQLDDVVHHAVHPAPAEPAPYEELLGRDFLFMLRLLADDTPLERTATIDEIVTTAVDEVLDPETSRCRFSAYRTDLLERLSALGGTKAGARLRIAVEGRRATLTAGQYRSWSDLVRATVGHAPLAPGMAATLAGIATDEGTDPRAMIPAVEALSVGEVLTESTVAGLMAVATSRTTPYSRRMRALYALAASRTSVEPIAVALVHIAAGSAGPDLSFTAMAALAGSPWLIGPVVPHVARLAVEHADEDVRTQAIRALAVHGALTEPVIAAAVDVAIRGLGHSSTVAVYALAGGESLGRPAIAALEHIAVDAADPAVRARALQTLAARHRLTATTLAAATELATSEAEPDARVRAVEVIAQSDALTEHIVGAAMELTADPSDRRARIEVVTALAAGEKLNGPTVAALRELAGSAAEPGVRLKAVQILRARALTGGEGPAESLVAAAIDVAAGDTDRVLRQNAVEFLADAVPTDAVLDLLFARFADDAGGVRAAIGTTLFELSRRNPERAVEIRDRLAATCLDPCFGVRDRYEDRTGWDYAHEALRRQVEIAARC